MLLGVAFCIARLLLWCCYVGCQVVAIVALGCCYGVARCCYGVAMVLLGGF